MVRYKARLVAQGFSQMPSIDFEETYSLIVDAIIFRFLLSLVISKGLQIHPMDVVTTYLYRSLDSDIYVKVLNGFKMFESCKSRPQKIFSIELQKSLYDLKQSGRM